MGLARRADGHAFADGAGEGDMLTAMFGRIGRWARPKLSSPAWSSGIGLARTLLALGTAGTLLATDPAVLMSPLSNGVTPPTCVELTKAGVWCLAPENLAVGRWLSIAVLLMVASGWRPRFTAIPHWWVSWSLISNVTIQDGGDQVAAVLTLLLIPICLTDNRRWHWHRYASASREGMGHVVARTTLLLIGIQMAVLYLDASIAKLGVDEWANGTAMYYWSQHPTFGTAPWLHPLVEPIVSSSWGVAMFTWGSIVLEFSLAVAILLRARAKWVLLFAGLAFHASIALDMGLVSFFAAMAGGLLLYLLPAGYHIDFPRHYRRIQGWVQSSVQSRSGVAQ